MFCSLVFVNNFVHCIYQKSQLNSTPECPTWPKGWDHIALISFNIHALVLLDQKFNFLKTNDM